MFTIQNMPVGEKPPNRFQYVHCHMVVDIKMEDFQRKASLVVGGHMTYMLNVITNLRVLTRKTQHISLTMAVLHELKVEEADVINVYVMVPNRK